ncbi:Fe(3+)-hydroxamate ABC transporter permease FhuB [Rhizobiales bacterium RZME27]|uniref:Fe(3+)-hydroxamate ABC transporter permease FhuB n=1 Tax=Endobacterium cereale TaxID=2663029 RepID=A0A6A8A7X6_9HYPH|nr:Fe(3+)-hydroxamate ABC transporter permease FhuB [Endobacterium cereale]MEB2847829.1 Fe(3+)-hydroxamate ABC transporter permease FhuB [Endobacterium cereale]MQY46834.1 Fe(3+)-hydroxamate ABC transporter permease FhuB [Endobacterium cereale]
MTRRWLTPARACILIVATAISLQMLAMLGHVPMTRLAQALWQPDTRAFGEVYIHFSLLPRMLVALLAGAALAFTGAIFQQVLKNPLAEPSTLGIMSGAQLAITLLTLSIAGVSGFQRELAGLAGGLAAVAFVAGLAKRTGFAPMTLLLCGMVISFTAGSASVILSLFHHEYLRSVFIWGSGSLIQNDYGNALALSARMIVLMPLLLIFVRPLAIAGLDDASARSLGLSPASLRLLVLLIATVLSAAVVARVGVIAFVGLGASNIARLAGARTLRQRLLWASLFGAALLLLADGLVLVSAPVVGEVPTGTVTAITGALLMLVFLKTMPASPIRETSAGEASHPGGSSRRFALPLCVFAAAVAAGFSLTEHFHVGGIDPSILFSVRWPRVLTSAAAGMMLALAGSITQAITRNPIASPEGLGVSGGAGLGIILAFFLGGMASPITPLLGGIAGSVLSFCLIILVARRRNYAPAPVLLTGIAIGALTTAVISLIVASGDPRASYILAWTMGPTFRATGLVAIIAAAIAGLALVIVPLFRRWLEVLPLGDGIAKSLGIRPGLARGTLLLFAATMTGIATMVVGPLSFVGLMAPHIARAIGPRGHVGTLLTSAAVGTALMIGADWLGRTVDFPYEIPAGVIAAFIGGPYFLWVICLPRRREPTVKALVKRAS